MHIKIFISLSIAIICIGSGCAPLTQAQRRDPSELVGTEMHCQDDPECYKRKLGPSDEEGLSNDGTYIMKWSATGWREHKATDNNVAYAEKIPCWITIEIKDSKVIYHKIHGECIDLEYR